MKCMPDPGMAQNPFPELSIIHYQFTHCRHKLQWVIFMQELNAQAARVWKRLALGQAYTKPKPQPKRSVPNPQPFDPNIYYLLFILYYLFFNPGPPILLCHSEAKPKNPSSYPGRTSFAQIIILYSLFTIHSSIRT